MKNTLKKIVFGILFFSLWSCSLDVEQNCTFEFPAVTTDVTGPETIASGEEIVLDVTFARPAACYIFSRFITTQQPNNVQEIKIMISNPTCDCNDIPVSGTEQYTLTPTIPGTYVFRFNTSETEFFVKEVIVE